MRTNEEYKNLEAERDARCGYLAGSGEAPLKEMDDLTHTIEITIHGNYPHGVKQHSSVSISGDGGIDHMIDAFKAALIAAGFTDKTVQRIFVEDRGDGPDQDGAGTESG